MILISVTLIIIITLGIVAFCCFLPSNTWKIIDELVKIWAAIFIVRKMDEEYRNYSLALNIVKLH